MPYLQYPPAYCRDTPLTAIKTSDLIKPDSFIKTTRYFWRKWRPILGNSLATLIIEARSRCYFNQKTGERRDFFYSSLEDFGKSAGFSVRQTMRLLKQPHADKFMKYTSTYFYNAELGKRVRGKSLFKVALEDPLIPQNEPVIEAEPIHNPATFRERPESQEVLKVATSKEQNTTKREQPNSQNVCNIFSTVNNNIKITNTKVNNNIEEFPDKTGKFTPKININDYQERIQKYDKPEKYQKLYNLIISKIKLEGPLSQNIFNLCFIGKVEMEEQVSTLIIDTPNGFCKQWFEKNYMKQMVSVARTILNRQIIIRII